MQNFSPATSRGEASKALSKGYLDSVFVAIMVGTAETFAIIFAVKRGLSSQQVALLTTAPVLLGALAQWIFPPLIKEKKLKESILLCHAIQVLGLIFLLAAVFLSQHLLWLFLALCFYWLGGMVLAPLWLDWMNLWFSDSWSFSKFLSKRNAIVALATVGSYLVVSLSIFQSSSTTVFVVPFLVALLARGFSSIVVSTQPSPPHSSRLEMEGRQQAQSSHERSVFLTTKSIVVMIGFTTLFRLASNVSSPFFIPYMLEDLKLPLLSYVGLTAVPFVGRFLFLARWGRSRKNIHPYLWLLLCMFGICVSPYLWTLTRNVHLIGLFELFSGLMWACFELCTTLLLQAYRPGAARGLLGMHLALMSFSALLGAFIGAEALSQWNWTYLHLFLRSAQFRLVVAFVFAIVILTSHWRKTRLQVYGDFLSNVLSLRPSLANIGRLIPVRAKSKK